MPSVQLKRHVAETTQRRVIKLRDGQCTTVHVARYARAAVRPKLVTFTQPTHLVHWCQNNNVSDAMVGGFFLRALDKLLGEVWQDGVRQESVACTAPWHTSRGSAHMSEGHLELAPRHELPAQPAGDLLQAGPLLVRSGRPLIRRGDDCEGFSSAAHQFDSDITAGRYPRAAIGTSTTHIWSVVSDGRRPGEAGLYLDELADIMITLGATTALNLDGGGSATQITGGQLQNCPYNFDGTPYPHGRAIHTAITFLPR